MFGEFGTNLEYAPYVIGDRDTVEGEVGQTKTHRDNGWWTLTEVGERAVPKIKLAFEAMARGLATWLDGKRL